MWEFLFLVLIGFLVGWRVQGFRRGMVGDSGPEFLRLFVLVALVALVLFGTSTALGWDVTRADALRLTVILGLLIGNVTGTSMGAILSTAASNVDDYGPPSATLSGAELRRMKITGDFWVLVVGPRKSGKSALVDRMVQSAVDRRSRIMTATVPRTGTLGDSRVTEVHLDVADGCALRFWETTYAAGSPASQPPLQDFDALIVVIDPTQLEHLSSSFPSRLRVPGGTFDGNGLILSLEDALSQSAVPPRLTWVVLSKVDLLRFSIAPPLVRFPIHIGHSWHTQMANMPLPECRRLLGALNVLRAIEPSTQLTWGTASPLNIFSGTIPGGAVPEFGGADLFDYVADAAVAAAVGN